MSTMLRIAAVALVAGVVAVGTDASEAGVAAGRPLRGRALLAPPDGAPPRAKGRIDFKFFPARGARNERSKVRFHLKHLDAGTTYTIWADDPSTPDDPTLVQVGDPLLAEDGDQNDDDQGEDEQGHVVLGLDSDQGDDMPLSDTLEDLQGEDVEIHDSNGATVLAGTFPTLD